MSDVFCMKIERLFRRRVTRRCFVAGIVAGLLPFAVLAQQPVTTAETAAQGNTSFIDPNGTAHVTRVVPVPLTISPEAQKSLARTVSDAEKPETMEERRRGTDTWQAGAGKVSQEIYPTLVSTATLGGVPVRIILPKEGSAANQDKILINLHGGGFNSDSGSLTETIPIAALGHVKVIAVLYRLAPEHPFPAAVDDAVAVYRELLKTYKPEHIGVYGTSAGAILTAEFAVKVKRLGLPEPASLGIFSGLGDFSRNGDSWNIYALNGFSGHLDAGSTVPASSPYVGTTDVKDPVLSPVFADLAGMPPTLFVTSTRDLLLSGTCNLQRAFLHAGVATQLVVFEALPHAFWNDPKLPESKEFDALAADFLVKHLGR